MMSSRWAG